MYKYIIILIFSVNSMIFSNGQQNSLDNRTYEYNLSDFSGIDGSAAFNIEVKKDDNFSVLIIADKSLEDKMIVEVRGNKLYLGMKLFSGFITKSPKAIITMPELYNVQLSGASEMVAAGFSSSKDFHGEISGASSLNLDIVAGNYFFEISGASDVYAVLVTEYLDMELSGSSGVELFGRAETVKIDASGASSGNLRDFIISDADLELAGSSDFYMNMTGTLNIDASGASTLYYTGNVTLEEIELSGASSIKEE